MNSIALFILCVCVCVCICVPSYSVHSLRDGTGSVWYDGSADIHPWGRDRPKSSGTGSGKVRLTALAHNYTQEAL